MPTRLPLILLGIVAAAGAFLTSCGSDNLTTPPSDIVILIGGVRGNMSFEPASVTVRLGQSVAFRNMDSVTHDIDQDAGRWDAGEIEPGAIGPSVRMTAAGPQPYHCVIHPSMVGSITVLP